MKRKSSSEPLDSIIRRLRQPASLRELIASCLRSVNMGDPFHGDLDAIPKTPDYLLENVEVQTVEIDGIPSRIYSPTRYDGNLPLMHYMHGGGFVMGCAADTDYITRTISHQNQMIVISVDYRLAPEARFPSALDDCEIVFKFAIENHANYDIDTNQIFIGGDSAGGNLALALCQRLVQSLQKIDGIVLLAPWLDMELEKYSSFNELAGTGIVMDSAFLAYARASYVDFKNWQNPLVSPLNCNIEHLPPTLILIGTEDPLVDQAKAFRHMHYTNSDTAAHIEVELFQGMPHCFYSFPNIFEEERLCFNKVSDFITQIKKR